MAPLSQSAWSLAWMRYLRRAQGGCRTSPPGSCGSGPLRRKNSLMLTPSGGFDCPLNLPIVSHTTFRSCQICVNSANSISLQQTWWFKEHAQPSIANLTPPAAYSMHCDLAMRQRSCTSCACTLKLQPFSSTLHPFTACYQVHIDVRPRKIWLHSVAISSARFLVFKAWPHFTGLGLCNGVRCCPDVLLVHRQYAEEHHINEELRKLLPRDEGKPIEKPAERALRERMYACIPSPCFCMHATMNTMHCFHTQLNLFGDGSNPSTMDAMHNVCA